MSAPVFRRLVLELTHGPIDDAAMRFVAEFARDLELDLFGVFVEDESLLNLAALPFAREIQLPTHDWRSLDPGSIADDMRRQAETMRRRVRRMLDQMGLRGGFEVRRGDPMHCVAGVCSAADIIVLAGSATPRRPMLESLRQAAPALPASVLVLPDRPVAHRGPVVVVTESMDDPAVELARDVARRHHARLLVILPGPRGGQGEQHGDIEIRTTPSVETDDVLRALAPVRERLVVIAHTAGLITGIEGASRIAAAGSVPVLVL